MEFQRLEKASPVEITYSGERLDLYSFGLFHLNMQEIVDKVSLGLLSQAGLLEPTWRRAKYLPSRPFFPSERIVKAELQQVRIGSLEEVITFSVATALADPNVIAVLQNLGANVLWAIAESGVRGIRERIHHSPNQFRWFNRDDDPVEIGPNLREVLMTIARDNNGKKAEIRYRSDSPNRGPIEVVIVIDGQ
ncbi:MAG TPA: hypothetical protein PK205_15235 [Promineifilum sp.]|nr:hypothetical protein [Promineifilum sp.]HRQ14655.1 hypothetical protein [Promineifilum sp.]